jgi:hypothetical protein
MENGLIATAVTTAIKALRIAAPPHVAITSLKRKEAPRGSLEIEN